MVLLGGIICIIWLVPVLYKINLEPTYYTIRIILFILGILGSYDFLKYRSKLKGLEKVYEAIDIELNKLPEAEDEVEASYQQIICRLEEIATQTKTKQKKQKKEMNDYYTLWAHQIKVPITALDLIIQSDDFGSRHMEIGQELFKIENYVEMVLQYLRIESIASDMMLKQYDVYTIVRNAVKKYSSMFISRKLTLNLSPFDRLAYTDEKWLSFVIEQILSNSLKYTCEGSITISLCQDRPNTLVIEDTGIGIKSEDLPRIFDKGFTGYNGRMHKKATGIGLYLCKQVCDQLAHDLSITAVEGVGTKVYVSFHRQQEEDFILQN